jgi:hypothetical protein
MIYKKQNIFSIEFLKMVDIYLYAYYDTPLYYLGRQYIFITLKCISIIV